MTKIIVTHDLGLSPENVKRLESLGDVTVYNSRPGSGDEWLERARGADIICSGIPGLREKYQELNNIFISLPLVGYSYLDKEVLINNNIKVANSPGCNKDAVAEWITGMIVNLFREMTFFINNDNLPKGKAPKTTMRLVNRSVLIAGKGNVGIRVGEICKILKMNVDFFKRGDDLIGKLKNKDVFINCLSANKTSTNLLDANFFNSLKKGSFFISVSNHEIYDVEAMFNALNNGIISGAAIDDGTMNVGNTENPFYQRLLKHPKIIATPHIAYNTDYTNILGNKMMIDNIEAYLKNKPINLIYS
ncbi:MAG: hydroxyacid dehydrogenase [Gammaproteobacteria bacterium]|nr:hydroxyacid dehydrogenase [Gammaproteobacteria bacterium]